MTIAKTAILFLTALMILSVFPQFPANSGNGGSGTVATGTEYLAFWSGELRIIAQKDYTQITLHDIRTGGMLSTTDSRLVSPLPGNPFILANAGDMWTGLGGMQSYLLEIQVKIVSQCANGTAEPKPVTVWTGLANPAYDPGFGSIPKNDPWMSYIPAISSETRYTGTELGTEFVGFTSDEMYIFAQKKAGITTNIVVDDLPSNDGDSDDSYSLNPSSPKLSYSDSEVEIYYITGFDDDVVWLTSNVVCSILAGKGSRDPDNEDWSASPPSYAAGDDGIELGTLFYTYGRHSLAVFPLEDDTIIQITDLSDGDDNWIGLLDGDDSDGNYEFYTATTQGLQGATITPRSANPAVSIITNSNPLDQDYVKITSDKPVLVYVGPVSSDVLEFADVAYSVPTGPDSREIYCYAQNHGNSMDLQIFAYDQNTNVTITSLTASLGSKLNHDFTIGPSGAESWSGTAGYGWWWGSGVWHGELLHITSDKPITVINGDYDQSYFGAFLPFTQVAPTLPPIAIVGADQTVYVGDTVYFDGSGSFDQDTFGNPPEIVSYEWDFDFDGITFDVDASGDVQIHTYNTPGNYTIRLFVTDNENETDDNFLVVTVLPPPNEPPVADAGLNQTVSEGDTVQFDGTGSSDPDGNITSYAWDFDANVDSNGDGNPANDVEATGPTPTHIYGDDGRGVDGNYTITLTVTDDGNLTDTDTCIVTVLNVDPTATIESATMDVEIVIRVAGSKWSNVGLTLYEGSNSIGYIEVERWPGSPDDNSIFENPALPTTLDLTKSYNAVVTYDPYPDSNDEIKGDQPNNGKDKKDNAGNPVWIVLRFENGSEQWIHHTFNTQQSMIRNSDHWNHVEPWEVELNGYLVGRTFTVRSKITDPGSDDEFLTYTYGTQTVIRSYYNNGVSPDPYPSPDVLPVDLTDDTTLIYEGGWTVTLTVDDDDAGSVQSSCTLAS